MQGIHQSTGEVCRSLYIRMCSYICIYFSFFRMTKMWCINVRCSCVTKEGSRISTLMFVLSCRRSYHEDAVSRCLKPVRALAALRRVPFSKETVSSFSTSLQVGPSARPALITPAFAVSHSPPSSLTPFNHHRICRIGRPPLAGVSALSALQACGAKVIDVVPHEASGSFVTVSFTST